MTGKEIARALTEAFGGRVIVRDDGNDNAVLRFEDGTALTMWQAGTWYRAQLDKDGRDTVRLPAARDWHELQAVVITVLAVRGL